ncbi:molybdenum cofactor synthesis domain-containing protein [Oscillochloris trichoides DG-6]|uniref:Molybdopterin molybdenumtransferase n=1 Tax=Oscillochloris trichoides DG-6 TaxID=765420 RepID=E1IC25_9CHLR|nr:molybdenum cofactor synthesis domain-containing protein [Oscillochloris trichoides DG-6]
MNPMLRESPYPMLDVEAALATVLAHVAPLALEHVDALRAEGRILAEDLVASEDLPDLPKAAMDGYALRSSDGLLPRRVIAELTAGESAGLLVGPGEASRIMTGATMPTGADAMIPVELTRETDGMLVVDRAIRPGEHVHPVGQDLARGQLVLARGTRLNAAEVGILATLGITQVAVFRQPRVAVLATGDEVYEPGAPRPAGAVRDSNRYALLAAVREAGGVAISLGIARDDAAIQRRAILDGIAQADVLLTSGGVSMGTRDLIKPILAELGTIHFGRVKFKPGKPTTFASVGDTLVFGLPGYPVSSLVAFEVFVRPALRALQGDPQPVRPRAIARIDAAIRPSPDRPEYQRVRLAWRGAELWATSTGNQGSSRLLSMHGANGLLIVPPGAQVYPAGSSLEVLVTGDLR